jgi:hypothetical protein
MVLARRFTEALQLVAVPLLPDTHATSAEA